MRRILFVGFAPNANESSSPSWDLIADANRNTSETNYVTSIQLPLSWERAYCEFKPMLMQNWDAVVLVGSNDISSVAVERLALNENNPAQKDAEGRRPLSKAIVQGGEAGYWTGFPYREMVIRMSEGGIPTYASHSAGGGIANHVFYKMMNWITTTGSQTVAGMIQIPNTQNVALMKPHVMRKIVPNVVDILLQSFDHPESLEVDLSKINLFGNVHKAN